MGLYLLYIILTIGFVLVGCMENLNYMQKGLLLATTGGYERVLF
jgi:hypothetical protein